MQTHPQRLRNRFCCSVRDKGCWRRWWCRASIVSAHFPPLVADRMANRVGCREVNWVGEFVEHQTKLAWSMMMNLVLLSSLFLSLSFLFFLLMLVPFSSRHEHGGVRQAEHPKTVHHRQRATAADSGEEINAFIPLHHWMEPTTNENSNTSQHTPAHVSL